MTPTLHFDFVNGKAEATYPCRCGQEHKGPHAAYDYGHHNCLHEAKLVSLAGAIEGAEGDVMCPLCGMTWEVGNL